MTGLHSITSANIQIESIQSCMVGRWIALDNLSQIHFERNRASAIICSVDQKPLFRLFLARPSEPGAGGNAPPPHHHPRFWQIINQGGGLCSPYCYMPPSIFSDLPRALQSGSFFPASSQFESIPTLLLRHIQSAIGI